MAKILLTGGAGFIGSHIAVDLIDAGETVVLADNFTNSTQAVLPRIAQITGKDVPFHQVDISDAAALDVLFQQEQFESVIHCAGLKSVDESVRQPLRYYRNNLDATMTLLETMCRHHVQRLVFSSSATVYGTSDAVPFSENMVLGGCTNPYGWTKVMAEQMIRDVANAQSGFSAVLLRYFNPVGAHDSGLLGEVPNGTPGNLMPFLLDVASGKRDMLSIYGNDYPTKDGTGVRDYLHIQDLAAGHQQALSYARTHTGVEAINLGSGVGYSVLDVIRTFEDVNEVTLPHQYVPRRPGDIAICFADTVKAKKLLGWSARKSLEDMCRDAWRWQQQQKN